MRRILVGLGVATAHFVVTALSLGFVLGDRMGPVWERFVFPVAVVLAIVLGFPGLLLGDAGHGRGGGPSTFFRRKKRVGC